MTRRKMNSKRIARKNKKFYLEVFTPRHEWKYIGTIFSFNNFDAFVTHFKQPDKHFYIKGLGYPVNEELLHMLKYAGIKHIIIPEKGKRGFKAYMGSVTEYLAGGLISEPQTEKQRSIPLERLQQVYLDEETIKKVLYG